MDGTTGECLGHQEMRLAGCPAAGDATDFVYDYEVVNAELNWLWAENSGAPGGTDLFVM